MKPKNLISIAEMRKVFGGKDLRKQRDELCYSQEYMANQLGLTQSTYQRLESGEIKISLERWIKISEILQKPNEKFTSSSNQIEQLQSIILKQERRIGELESEIAKLKLPHHPNIAAEMTRIT